MIPKKRHPLQITFDNILAWQVFEEAEQLYFDPFHFPDEEVPRAPFRFHSHWPEDWHERQNRLYHVFLAIEKLLKQIARHRKIKGFKPEPSDIYSVINGEKNYKDLIYAKTNRAS